MSVLHFNTVANSVRYMCIYDDITNHSVVIQILLWANFIICF